MKVSICIITFRRLEGLKRLLDSLNRLEFKSMPPPDVELVVVDNDPDGLASALCQGIKAELRWPLFSCVEPRRGIAAARNTCIAHALIGADFVASIDDDEYAEPCWLEHLLCAALLHEADVVTGPLIPEFEEGIPDWIKRGGFFQRPRFRTGERIKFALTGNVLVRATVFHRMGSAFDERFSMTGGEDTHFFTRVYLAGHKMIFANDAVVREVIPVSRANVKWLLMRAYSNGSILSRCERDLMPSLKRRCRRFAGGVRRLVQGLCLILPGCFLGRIVLVKGLRQFFTGLGMLAGPFGARYQQYRQKTGE